MLAEHIIKLLKTHLQHKPTRSQDNLIDGFGKFITSPEAGELMLIKGYAGTGKTWLVSALVKVLSEMEINSVLMAPTGRAAKVFGSYANQSAFTIHKLIYRQKSSGADFGMFSLNWNRHKDTLFIVDEASMISNSSFEYSAFGSGRLLNDVLEFVQNGSNCKLIIIGDSAQLPPIGLAQSPALDKTELESLGYHVTEYFLNEVVRQSKDSGILSNATVMREAISLNSSNTIVPKIKTDVFTDVENITGEYLIENISSCYDKYGIENTVVICRSNKRASLYNKGIRGSILYREEELTSGDYLMVVKNNYFWAEEIKDLDFIANGDIAEVIKIFGYEELYGFRFANVLLRLLDHDYLEIEAKIILDILTTDNVSFTKEQNETFYKTILADYQDINNKKKQFDAMKKNPYFNALQVKYGYAITCHKSQGGQWDAVFIDQGMVKKEDKGVEYLRWLYTAITRATEKLFLVNFPDDQIEKQEHSNE